MYETYIREWKQYYTKYGPQTALFYMVGKFYELYDILDLETNEGQTSVRQAVETMGITLTVKEKEGPKGEDCLFAGFPEQSLQKFAAILTRQGWTVVTCNQTKNEKGAVTDRPVFRIFSPGTHMETAGAESPYLAGLWLEEQEEKAPIFATTVLDLTTGQLVSYSGEAEGSSDTWSADHLIHFFQVHPPREMVVWWKGPRFTEPNDSSLRRRIGYPKGALHRESGNNMGALEKAALRENYLARLFKQQQGLLPLYDELHLRKWPLIEYSLIHILRFAEDHMSSALQNLHEHIVWQPEFSVYLGNNSLLQLNYIQQAGSQDSSVLSLFEKTTTSLGRRALRTRLLVPSADPSLIQKRLTEVTWFYHQDASYTKQLQGWLRMIQDLSRLHRKIMLYSVDATDVLALDQSYGSIGKLIEMMESSPLAMSREKKNNFQEYLETFHNNIDLVKARLCMSSSHLSFLPDMKAPRTAAAEARFKELRGKIQEILIKIQNWVGLPQDALRLDEGENDSYLITATKTVLDLVNRKLASTAATSWPYTQMSVQTKKSSRGCIHVSVLEELHGKILATKHQHEAAIRQELPILCNAIQSPCMSFLEEWVAAIDVNFTLARVAKERGYTCPNIENGKEGGFSIEGLRHPLLEMLPSRVEYVKHTISLGLSQNEEAAEDKQDNGWLLYGMNASGKSSLMKATGIAVLLAQAGSYVPASKMRLVPFQSILTRIWNQDNLWAGLSSFAVEVSELRDIFARADARSLVLGDELCSGTESVSATSLVAAGIQYLHEQKSRFIFATHLHGLMDLEEIRDLPQLGIWHLKVHYDAASDRLHYDRTLHKGPGGTLYGLEVAKAMHLSYPILKNAHRYRKQLLGEKTEEEACVSSWNTDLTRKVCEVCGESQVRLLEVHHIRPRAEGIDKRLFEDGTAIHHLRNLVVLCEGCHTKHHAGEMEIASLQQTSDGPRRMVVETQNTKIKKTSGIKWTTEQVEQIESYIRKYPNCTMKRAVYDLKQDGIEISESSLRKFRQTL